MAALCAVRMGSRPVTVVCAVTECARGAGEGGAVSRQLDVLRRRLMSWERELLTNRYGMAQVAQRSIAVLRQEIAEEERLDRILHGEDIDRSPSSPESS